MRTHMRTILFVTLVCCCIGGGQEPSQKCQKPALTTYAREYTSPDGETGFIFNGVFYSMTGEFQGDVTSLNKRDVDALEILTVDQSRNPSTIVVKKDGRFLTFRKSNAGRVIFIEMKKRREATLIRGKRVADYEGSPMNYVYDSRTGTLRAKLDFPLDETVIVLCGVFQEKVGDEETGKIWFVRGVSDFPGTVADAEIMAVDDDGTVHLFLFCTYLTISPGESETVDHSFEESVLGSSYMIMVTYTVTNYGFINVEDITVE